LSKTNGVILICLLKACRHSVDKGLLFQSS
jgi:hypothetical protein